MKTTSLRITEELDSLIKQRCMRLGVGQSTLIRLLISEGIARHDQTFHDRCLIMQNVMRRMRTHDENKTIIELAERYLNDANYAGYKIPIDHE